jgi:hypothetical protein
VRASERGDTRRGRGGERERERGRVIAQKREKGVEGEGATLGRGAYYTYNRYKGASTRERRKEGKKRSME